MKQSIYNMAFRISNASDRRGVLGFGKGSNRKTLGVVARKKANGINPIGVTNTRLLTESNTGGAQMRNSKSSGVVKGGSKPPLQHGAKPVSLMAEDDSIFLVKEPKENNMEAIPVKDRILDNKRATPSSILDILKTARDKIIDRKAEIEEVSTPPVVDDDSPAKIALSHPTTAPPMVAAASLPISIPLTTFAPPSTTAPPSALPSTAQPLQTSGELIGNSTILTLKTSLEQLRTLIRESISKQKEISQKNSELLIENEAIRTTVFDLTHKLEETREEIIKIKTSQRVVPVYAKCRETDLFFTSPQQEYNQEIWERDAVAEASEDTWVMVLAGSEREEPSGTWIRVVDLDVDSGIIQEMWALKTFSEYIFPAMNLSEDDEEQ